MMKDKKIHELKILPCFFEEVCNREKQYELRRNDRDFRAGDMLRLNEFQNEKYTGMSILVSITHVLHGFEGLQSGFVILGIEKLT